MRVNESALRDLLREVAITGDATAGQSGRDDKQMQSTLPSDVPIAASQQAATQLSVSRPPVEDPNYVPISAKDLGLALQAIAEVVPESDVKQVYLDFIRRVGMRSDPLEAGNISKESFTETRKGKRK
jgi:hypothetical protein